MAVKEQEHIVSSYEEELTSLDNQIAKMGGVAEEQLANAFDALERRDPELAETTIKSDRLVDDLERGIEEQAITMIARRQPGGLGPASDHGGDPHLGRLGADWGFGQEHRQASPGGRRRAATQTVDAGP